MCCWCGGGTTTTDPVCLPGGGANGVWNVMGTDQSLLSGANQGDMFGYRIHLGGYGGEFLVVTAPGCYKHSGDGLNPNLQLDVPTCTTPTTSNGYARVFERAVDAADADDWTQIGSDSDISGEKPGDYFGLSLAVGLHASRATIIVGAPLWKDLNFPGELRVGRVYAYAYDDLMTYRYRHFKTLQGDSQRDKFGWSLATDRDGGHLAVGAQTADPNGELDGFRGVVQVYHVVMQQGLSSSSFVISGTIYEFEPVILTTALATALEINASTVNLTAEGASIRVTATIEVPTRNSAALVSKIDTLFSNVSAASATLGVAVETYEGTSFTEYMPPPAAPSSPPRPPQSPPRPPQSPLPPSHPPSPPHPPRPPRPPALPPPAPRRPPTPPHPPPRPPQLPWPPNPPPSPSPPPPPPSSPPPQPPNPPLPPRNPPTQPCAEDGSDDTCSPFAAATWSSALAEFYMYLYDETPDDQDFKIWEWPRVEPSGDAFRNNGYCEDGQPPMNSTIPMGEYYIAFGSGNCANMYVNLSTGLIGGCGKVMLVPCAVGTVSAFALLNHIAHTHTHTHRATKQIYRNPEILARIHFRTAPTAAAAPRTPISGGSYRPCRSSKAWRFRGSRTRGRCRTFAGSLRWPHRTACRLTMQTR